MEENTKTFKEQLIPYIPYIRQGVAALPSIISMISKQYDINQQSSGTGSFLIKKFAYKQAHKRHAFKQLKQHYNSIVSKRGLELDSLELERLQSISNMEMGIYASGLDIKPGDASSKALEMQNLKYILQKEKIASQAQEQIQELQNKHIELQLESESESETMATHEKKRLKQTQGLLMENIVAAGLSIKWGGNVNTKTPETKTEPKAKETKKEEDKKKEEPKKTESKKEEPKKEEPKKEETKKEKGEK